MLYRNPKEIVLGESSRGETLNKKRFISGDLFLFFWGHIFIVIQYVTFSPSKEQICNRKMCKTKTPTTKNHYIILNYTQG